MKYRASLIILIISGLAVLTAACGGLAASGSSVGGSVLLDRAADSPPFYEPIMEQALIDSRQLSARPLAAFEPPTGDKGVVGGSAAAFGRLGDLLVGKWQTVDDELGLMECIGFTFEPMGSGSECTQAGTERPGPEVFYQVECRGDARPHWIVFTVDERIDALRVDVEADVSVVGDDPLDTGLVAVEAIGNVVAATAQTTTGQVWTLAIEVACPTSA